MANENQREELTLVQEIAGVMKTIKRLKEQSQNATESQRETLDEIIETETKRLDVLTTRRKLLTDIKNSTVEDLRNTDRAKQAEFDINNALKKRKDFESKLKKLNKDKSNMTKAEYESAKDSLDAKIQMVDQNIKLGKHAKKVVKTQDQLLGALGSSKQQIEGMVDGAKDLLKGMAASPYIALAAVFTGMFLAIKNTVSAVKDLGKELSVSLPVARELQKELAGAEFGLQFAMKALNTFKEKGLKETGKLFKQAFDNKILGVTQKDITAIMNEMKDIDGTLMDPKTAQGLAKNAAMLNISGKSLVGVANQMRLAGSGATNIEEAIKQSTALAVDLGSLTKKEDIAGVFDDIAKNTQLFAEYGKDGGANMIKAAAHAKKLGLELSTMGKITDSLLDFENSIEKEMEASLMIGKQLNYDTARRLALEGDMAGAAKEVANQIGGAAEFNKMNVLQRRALAESIGVSADEMQKLLAGGEIEVKQDPIIKSQEELKGSIDELTKAMVGAVTKGNRDIVDAAQVGTSPAIATGLAIKGAKPLIEEAIKAAPKAGSMGSKILKGSKFLGPAATAIGLGVDAIDVGSLAMDESATKQDVTKRAAEATGGFAGALAGMKLGAAAGGAGGAFFGGAGALPGALAGGIIGAIGGALGGSKLFGSAADEFDIGGTSELTAVNAQAQVAQEFRDLSNKQKELLEKQFGESGTTQELLNHLQKTADKNDSDMQELIEVMKQVVSAGLATNVSVQGLTNNN